MNSRFPVVIAAVSLPAGVIGVNNKLPWSPLKADFEFMKHLTLRSPSGIIMGRRTYESIGRPLPNRTSLVITQTHRPSITNGKTTVHFIDSLDSALTYCQAHALVPIIFGGEMLYKEALQRHQCTVYLTQIYKAFEGDTCFPMDLIECSKLTNITREALEIINAASETKENSPQAKHCLEFLETKESLVESVKENNVSYSFFKLNHMPKHHK